jgi:CheY-like chemotaxis protein
MSVERTINMQSPKIVVVNDEPFLLQMFEALIRLLFPDSDLLLFSSGPEAWENLLRSAPDILITGDRMPGLYGEEICQRLSERKASFPIVVTSAWEPTEQWVSRCASRGLNVRLLPAPFTPPEFENVLKTSLKIVGGK